MGLFDRIFGHTRSNQTTSNAMTASTAEQIVQRYGAVLNSSAPAPGCVADTRDLPYPKGHIKQALVFALRSTKDAQMREHLKVAYISLTDWQEGVGNTPVGLNLTKIDLNANSIELAKQISSQSAGMDHWLPVVKAEQESLKSELQSLGLW